MGFDWITQFEALFADTGTPPLFARWCAISSVAAAMERKTWVVTRKGPLYPNLYTFLISPPGIGKTMAIATIRDTWKKLPNHNLARSSVTKASMIDDLNEAKRSVFDAKAIPSTYTFNSLYVTSNELEVFLPGYETEFIGALTDLYDGKGYSESRRTMSIEIEIENPNINLIGGCTPGYLRDVMPMGAWDHGFLARVILIYSGWDGVEHDIFDEDDDVTVSTEAKMKQLQERLVPIGEMYGGFLFENNAKQFINNWKKQGQQPKPDHPRLSYYCTRRVAHLIKLSMVSAASSRAKLVVTLEDVQRALDWLVEAEFAMADIFKSMTAGGDSQIIEDTWHFLFQIYMKGGKKPVPEFKLVQFLHSRTPAHNIVRVLDIMERANMIKKQHLKGVGMCYTPREKVVG